MYYAVYAAASLLTIVILVAVFLEVRRKIALSGLTDEQYMLMISLERAYQELWRRRKKAYQREQDILVQGGPYTSNCREELEVPSKQQEQEVAKLEQECRAADIPEWRISPSVLRSDPVE